MDEEVKQETTTDTVTIEMPADKVAVTASSTEQQIPEPQQEISEINAEVNNIQSVKCLTDECDMSFATVGEFEEHNLKMHLKDVMPIVEKHAGGRPCEYCQNEEKILKITEEYLATRSFIEKPRMPFWGELAILLDRDDWTLTEWADKKDEDGELKHPKFHALKKKFNSVQHLRLQQRLMGRYNPTGSIMWLKTKFGYIETEKQILAGDANNKLEIVLTEERKLPDGQ